MSSSSSESAALPAAISWQDFDDPRVFGETQTNAAATDCVNFVLEFGPNKSRIVRDLPKDHFDRLLNHDARDIQHPIRWINVWDTSASKEAVELISQKYAFSQRLQALMVNARDMQQQILQAANTKKKKRNIYARPSTAARNASANTVPMATTTTTERVAVDPEKGLADVSSPPKLTVPGGSPVVSSLEGVSKEEIELYLLLKETPHYSSIDHTDKALCIGAHWLHQRPQHHNPSVEVEEKQEFMPPKHWLWLVLCDDHTVITLHESPKLEKTPKGWDETEWRNAQYKNMRANSLNVLLQQSNQGMNSDELRPLSQNSIRQALKKSLERSGGSSGHTTARQELSRINSDMPPIASSPGTTLEDEGTSSLFYYLFEDYSAAGPLKAAGKILEELTPKVLHSIERKSRVKSRDIIPPLFNLSKDLRKLKHLFENYTIVIGKIMAATKRPGPPTPADPWAAAASTMMAHASESNVSESLIMGSDPDRKVFLTSSALQRFDRLRDRLKWFMLNTVDGHFEEIKALQDTYFNLTQQKDSNATARLTRSATLLAKLSVFFLPISFITAYFSIQIEDLYAGWTAPDYWWTFGITLGVSFLALTFFGRMLMFFSDVLDDWSERFSGALGRVARAIGFRVGDDDDDDEE